MVAFFTGRRNPIRHIWQRRGILFVSDIERNAPCENALRVLPHEIS
jgi:hypothetical protein